MDIVTASCLLGRVGIGAPDHRCESHSASLWGLRGNLTNDGSANYLYDRANRLISTTLGGVTTQFSYTGDGARLKQIVARTPTTYTQDPSAGSRLTRRKAAEARQAGQALAAPLPWPTWTKQPTLTPRLTLTPAPTFVPTLLAADLSDEAIAHMAVWRRVENDTLYPLYQISHTPMGVISLDWSPNARSLWLNIATGPGLMSNIAPAASLVVNRGRPTAFGAGQCGLEIVNVAEGTRQVIAPRGLMPMWSPAGTAIAFVSWRSKSPAAHSLMNVPVRNSYNACWISSFVFITNGP